jgi:threonine dehydrogenase-like Zn-dependent dehydrogenase
VPRSPSSPATTTPGDGRGGFDLVVESAGTAEAYADAARLARPGGTVLLLSMHWTPTASPGLALWFKELQVLHSFVYCARGGRRDIDEAAALLARRPEIAEVLVTHRFPLDAAAEAFAVARDRAAGAIKVVLEP